MKKFLNEFKEFAVKGNVLNLAIGVIIGGAFQKIVTSLINDLIMPFIGLITGSANFNGQSFQIGSTTFNYGAFISSVIDFLIMAFVIFLMVKAINKVTSIAKDGIEKIESKVSGEVPVEETPIIPSTKICPYCLSEVPYAAIKCSHCTSEIPNSTYEETEEYLE